MEVPAETNWLEPWRPVGGGDVGLVEELRREVGAGHLLFGRETEALARRIDCDDVLFATSIPSSPLAVVHLTWSGHALATSCRQGSFCYTPVICSAIPQKTHFYGNVKLTDFHP